MPRRKKQSSEAAVRDIRRKTRRRFSAEEKIRIVLDGLRGEVGVAELCRREGIAANLYYRWSKDFLEAGKKQLSDDTVREATSTEVKDLRAENSELKEVVAEMTPQNRVLTKGLSVLETQSILKRANYFLPPPFFLNPLGAISSSSHASSSRNAQSDPRQCRGMQKNPERSKRLQERTAKNRTIQEIAELHRIIPAISKKIQGVELRQGIVLADTKTARATFSR